ncbi:uncharacterized protein LOC111003552 [Pieris rapae]|uniref:uncharacterized protein LOC111003552 n=1 Tax=Pieris rapae TaxID=64459 RepID=UPI001E2817FC|nr:uncharacterized protein LOC111003552 [Pieris rapae]
MKSYSFLFVIIILGIMADEESEDRTKRQINALPLVYPYGAIYKLILGLTTPIPTKDHVNLAFLLNFQYQYMQFQNISQLSKYYIIKDVSREEREADWSSRYDERLVFYNSFADMLEMKGLSGQDCVQRAICEAAQFSVSDDGLFGEIIHVLLTPDYGKNLLVEDSTWKDDMASYIDAATAGRQMFECSYIYNNCPEARSVLDLISMLTDE